MLCHEAGCVMYLNEPIAFSYRIITLSQTPLFSLQCPGKEEACGHITFLHHTGLVLYTQWGPSIPRPLTCPSCSILLTGATSGTLSPSPHPWTPCSNAPFSLCVFIFQALGTPDLNHKVGSPVKFNTIFKSQLDASLWLITHFCFYRLKMHYSFLLLSLSLGALVKCGE